MNISNLILAGNYVEAKNQISERLNEIALGLMESAKEVYAQHLFVEEFDAKFKDKTDMDFVKDAKSEDDGDAPHGEMPVGDEGETEEPEKDEGEEESDEEPEGEEESDEKPAKNIKAGKGENINITVNESHELHEVSKALLGRYIKSAGYSKELADKGRAAWNIAAHKIPHPWAAKFGQEKYPPEKVEAIKNAEHHERKSNNRVRGINKAVDKLVSEEEAHELHEVSKNLADRYLSKNGNDMAKQWNAGNDRKVSNRLKGTARATRIMQGVKLSSKKLTEGEDK